MNGRGGQRAAAGGRHAAPAPVPRAPARGAANPHWQRLAHAPLPVTTTAGDAAERAADALAAHALAAPDERAPPPADPPGAGAPRARPAGAGAGEALGLARSGVAGAGEALAAPLRTELEARFDADFGAVRVHTGPAADGAARGLCALAYTLGSRIAFRTGRFAPASAGGRHLLAHELAHTLQQAAGRPVVQRAADPEFGVTQVQPEPERRTQGMANRVFFGFDRDDFSADVPAEVAERERLEAWADAHAGTHVRLVGRASQEGDPDHNRGLAARRAATVRRVLAAHGVSVDGVRVDMSYRQSPIDYRFYRSVELITAADAATGCAGFTAAQQQADATACEDAFTEAQRRASAIATAALARLSAATDPAAAPAPDRDAVLATRFPGIDRATLLPRFESVVNRVGAVAASDGHACRHRCAPGCERAASAGAGGPLTLCAAFYLPGYYRGATMSEHERVFLVLHETTHSAVEPGSAPAQSIGVDVAYSRTRLFGVLNGSEALGNADSYVVTLLTLARATEGAPAVLASVGAAPTDTVALATPPGEPGDRARSARRAIGYAGSWLNYAAFWTPTAYDFVAASLARWDPGRLGRLGHSVLELYAPLFELEHPGASAVAPEHLAVVSAFQAEVPARGFALPPVRARATTRDRTRLAGVYDRLSRMLDGAGQALSIDAAASGDGAWASAPGLPGLGTSVHLADGFFALTPALQVRHVLRLMARALADVGAGRVEAYVEAADAIHRLRGLGP
ncbi:uncharacterized protein DUF4157 [Plasticicumulans lactativorans]|uniref:Uncharacterized protein DUF4157 n=1 Tax=Plasticicumulans lactativorans TaxID=1133106 RepID=A0A4R2L2S4_9GAMM|nr:DUF4157 domain-containing protein [Plasticicumulans lactativorans]TCO80653.1 uncharacterized protein DUF4157 [Plasticicumulans lactativorans]